MSYSQKPDCVFFFKTVIAIKNILGRLKTSGFFSDFRILQKKKTSMLPRVSMLECLNCNNDAL